MDVSQLNSFIKLILFREDIDWNGDNGQYTLLQYAADQVYHYRLRIRSSKVVLFPLYPTLFFITIDAKYL